MLDQIDSNVFAWLVVLALAAYRFTRLIVLDEVLGSFPAIDPRTGDPIPGDRGDGLRRLIDIGLYDDEGDARNSAARWVGRWLTCTYCCGFWMSAAVVAAWEWWAVDWVRWVIVVFAIAGAQGYINSRPGA
jgi:hypothetical protein